MARHVVIAQASDWRDGSMAPVEVEGHRIGLCRIGGTFYAFDDHCPHAGSTLALGTLHGNAVECPRHEFFWRATDGAPLTTTYGHVPTFKVWVEGDDVLMEMPDAWPEPAHWRNHPKREELRRRHGFAPSGNPPSDGSAAPE